MLIMSTDFRALNEIMARKLKALIKTRGLNQTALEQASGVSQSDISGMSKMGRGMIVHRAFKLARAAGVTLDWLADPEQTGEPPSEGEVLNAAEAESVRLVRLFGLNKDDVTLRLAQEPAKRKPAAQAPAAQPASPFKAVPPGAETGHTRKPPSKPKGQPKKGRRRTGG